jgi:hypothetical protein
MSNLNNGVGGAFYGYPNICVPVGKLKAGARRWYKSVTTSKGKEILNRLLSRSEEGC